MILPFAMAFALLRAEVLLRNSLGGVARISKLVARNELLSVVFWLFLAANFFAAIVLSHSRMGMISALVSLITVIVLDGISSLSARTRATIAALFFLGVAGLVVWIGSDPVISRFETLGQEYNLTGQSRISFWHDTLGLLRRHPFFGTGFGSFSVAYPSVQTAFLNLLVEHAHCDYLEVVSELGFPGGLLPFASLLSIPP